MSHIENRSDVQAARADVKSEIAKILIDAMQKQATPWQRPWSAASMRPMNPTSGNAYKGINRLLLSLSGMDDPRWMTYQQAAKAGWQVRRGEKGSSIIKLVEVGPQAAGASGSDSGAGSEMAGSGSARAESMANGQRKAFALRRYTVFNAKQIEGVPELQAPPALDFNPVDRAEAVLEALKQTGLVIIHGGAQACYIPALDQARLPAKKAFHSVHDYYSTALHEGAHSTLHEKRMDRREALGKKWGDEAYAVEELRAEICSAILAAETGVPMSQAHIDNHAAYLQNWVKVVAADPMAIFSAAKDAEAMAGYMLSLEKKMTANATHREWVEDYDLAASA
jgi:antirestriction protein ArdC